MSTPIPRRTVLAAAGATAVGLSVPGVAQAADRKATKIEFTLNAETLDGGEQVTSVTLATAELGAILPASLTADTFTVHAKATSPIQVAAGDTIYSEYDLDRPVTTARLDRRGNIVLELDHAEGQVGGGTLGYIVSSGRNVQLDLVYTITQNAPLKLRNGRTLAIKKLVQGDLSNPEVDAFGYAVSPSKMKYRLYSPDRARGKRPLIVWLHGGGEGASLPDNYYDNESTLRANRGALGFATPQGQRIFGGAYVVAPQSTSAWMLDGPTFAPQIKEIIDEVARRYPIDRDRIHVVGCSNGGYMTMKMTVEYPKLFASAVPICGVSNPSLPPAAVADHRCPADQDHDADLAGRLGRRHDGRSDRPTPSTPTTDPAVDHDHVQQRHLGRSPVRRPLVVDLRRPQRPPPSRHPHLAVDGASGELRRADAAGWAACTSSESTSPGATSSPPASPSSTTRRGCCRSAPCAPTTRSRRGWRRTSTVTASPRSMPLSWSPTPRARGRRNNSSARTSVVTTQQPTRPTRASPSSRTARGPPESPNDSVSTSIHGLVGVDGRSRSTRTRRRSCCSDCRRSYATRPGQVETWTCCNPSC